MEMANKGNSMSTDGNLGGTLDESGKEKYSRNKGASERNREFPKSEFLKSEFQGKLNVDFDHSSSSADV